MNDANIKIIQLKPSDWAMLRAIRLEALQSDPHAFGSTFAAESERDEQDWRRRLANPDFGIFGVFKGQLIIGMTGIRLIPEGREASLWGSWLRPDQRGLGLSRDLYQVRFDWARQTGLCDAVTVSHRASNIASRQANQKHGFEYTHTESTEWPDGQIEDQLFYKRPIQRDNAAATCYMPRPISLELQRQD